MRYKEHTANQEKDKKRQKKAKMEEKDNNKKAGMLAGINNSHTYNCTTSGIVLMPLGSP